MEKPDGKKLLIISEMGIGDALTLFPAIVSLQKVHPTLHISLLAPGISKLQANFHGIEFPDPPEMQDIAGLKKWLNLHPYDFIWNTENEKSLWRSVLSEAQNQHWISAPAHRTWPRKFVLNLRHRQLRGLFPELPDYTDFRLPLTNPQSRIKETVIRDKQRTRWIAVQAGAKDRTKCWPAAKFEKLITELTRLRDCRVKLFLTETEKAWFTNRFLSHTPGLDIIMEPLDRALPVLAACDLFAGNDSGFYHLSHALGLKTVGIYRSRHNMKVWSYPDCRSRAVCFWLPSFIRQHWHRFIPVRRVLKSVRSLLDEPCQNPSG